ncbi:MAG: NAD-dependent epimerase/dehydratase family protein [Planctomycetaceae bacterium]|nr:NAD-dependent epimerase/dehydratase family protein [Planctomycetaceae bacterium]
MKALVTGGGGFLGLYIVEQLLEQGDDVRVYCRGSYPALQQLDVEIVNGDVRDVDRVTAACESIDAVFHVAAVPGVWGDWEMFHGINTLGTQNVISACLQQNVARLIYTSSPSVVFDGHDHINADESLPYPQSWLCHYPHSKALGEQAVLAASDAASLKTVSLRPHLIWGQRDNHLLPRLIQRAKSGRLRRVGPGTNEVSVVNVENAAAAHLQAERALRDHSQAAGNAYFINEPTPVNLWNWIDELLGIAGLSGVQKSISLKSARRIGHVLEGAWSLLKLSGEPPMTRFVAEQLAGSHSYSIAAAQRDFGFEPIVTMQQGMDKVAEDLRRLAAS